jgi:hypothetical protein
MSNITLNRFLWIVNISRKKWLFDRKAQPDGFKRSRQNFAVNRSDVSRRERILRGWGQKALASVGALPEIITHLNCIEISLLLPARADVRNQVRT